MKKKTIIFIITLFAVVISLVIVFKPKYTIKIKIIDNYSPDRILEVFKNNKELSYKEIRYLDGTKLCDFKNSTVSYADVSNEKELIIVLKNKSKVKAKIIN